MIAILDPFASPRAITDVSRAVSCSVPFVFAPYTLMTKDHLTGEPVPWTDYDGQYIDGSVDGDLPMNRLSEMFNVNHFIVSQVNPHVVPFLPKDDGPDQSVQASFTAPRWLLAMTHLAKDEILHRMTVMSELGIFPTQFTKTVSIVNQKYSGDITIYPEIQLSQVPVMLKNPTTEFMLKACLSGERATWPKLGRIRNHCAIELALDSAIQKMRARVAFHPSRINVKSDSMADHSLESFDSSGGRGRLLNRRSSYNHELEKTKHLRHIPSRQTRPYLQRSRSVLLSEQSRSIDSVASSRLDQAVDQRTESYQNSSMNTGDGPYATGSDSDEESGASPPGHSGSPRSHVSWEPSSEDHPFAWSSLDGSAHSSQSFASAHSRGSSHRDSGQSPQTSHAVRIMPEKSLSPPRHHLQMTPSAYVRSPNSGRFLN